MVWSVIDTTSTCQIDGLHEPIDTSLELAKDLHRELVSQVLVANRSRVQIVARVVLRSKLAGDTGVSEELVEISNGVESAGVADEVVDLLSV